MLRSARSLEVEVYEPGARREHFHGEQYRERRDGHFERARTRVVEHLANRNATPWCPSEGAGVTTSAPSMSS